MNMGAMSEKGSSNTILTVPVVAEMVGVHPVTFRRWCEQGKGPKHMLTPGKTRLFRQKDVEEWLMAAEKQGGSNGG